MYFPTCIRSRVGLFWTAFVVLVMLIGCAVGLPQTSEQESALRDKFAQSANDSVVHEEVVVAASLYVRKKPNVSLRRQQRRVDDTLQTVASIS